MARNHRESKERRRDDQLCVVVRVDIVIYVLVGVITVLAMAAIVLPGRVEVGLITSLGTLMAGVLGGWLTYMRLATRNGGHDDEGDDGASDVDIAGSASE